MDVERREDLFFFFGLHRYYLVIQWKRKQEIAVPPFQTSGHAPENKSKVVTVCFRFSFPNYFVVIGKLKRHIAKEKEMGLILTIISFVIFARGWCISVQSVRSTAG